MADRYWVGGSGSWNASSTTNWSATSGGAGGASIPGTGDNAIFDANSGSGSYTVATSSNLNCLNFNITQPVTGTLTFNGNGIVNCYGNLNCNGGNIVWSVVANFIFVGTGTQTVKTGGITFNRFVFNGTTFTLLDTLTVTVNFQINNGILVFNNQTVYTPVLSISGGGTRTLDFTSGGIINIPGNASTVINGAATTGLTILGNSTVNLTYSGNTGTRTVNIAAGAVGYLNINVTAGSDTVAIGNVLGSLNLTGFTGFFNNVARTMYGNLILGSSMTASSGAAVTTFAANTVTQIFDSANITTPFSITIGTSSSNGTVIFSNAVTLGNTNSFTVTGGTFNANSYNLTTGTFVSSNTNTRTINISNATVTIAGAALTAWNMATSNNANLIATNSNIAFSNNSTTTRGISSGTGLTYGNLIMGGANVAQFQFFGNSTYSSITSTKTVPQTILFTGNSTTTVNNWSVPGTANANVTLSSDSLATFNLIKTGSGTVNVNYYTITRSNASPNNTWYSLLTNNNIDGGNNTGWIFTYVPPPPSTSNYFLVF